jgi:hypothetical protein
LAAKDDFLPRQGINLSELIYIQPPEDLNFQGLR